jgi:hypothetical protein
MDVIDQHYIVTSLSLEDTDGKYYPEFIQMLWQ